MAPISTYTEHGSDNITPLPSAELAESSIQQFYKGATVFITGGTGFVGQLIIEKLLRCCPGLKKIYVLVRPSKGKDIHTRLRELFETDIYEKLREVNPDFQNQVAAIAGDCAELELGISNDDKSLLVDEVTVIFHSAATIRFNEPLKTAVDINTRGAREMVRLAKACKHLKAFVHVSTAYSNCFEPEIEEKFYDIELPGDKLIDMVENMKEDSLNRITDGLIAGHPNTYTYTKKAAEDIFQKNAQDLPCAIVRPSIITGTAKEPLEGWSGNVYGVGGIAASGKGTQYAGYVTSLDSETYPLPEIFLGVGIGVIRSVYANENKVLDLVPGDFVANNCIAAAWATARSHKAGLSVEPRIYMCGTSPQTRLIWKDFVVKSISVYRKIPSSKAIYKAFYFMIPLQWDYKLRAFFLHWIPAYVVDTALVVIGKKPMLKKIYAKVDQMIEVISYFGLNEWVFHNDNTTNLYKGLTKRDKEMFNFDLENFDVDAYITSYVYGIRRYLMKDPDDTLPQGKAKMRKLVMLHYFVCSITVLFLYGIFYLFSIFFFI